MWKGKIQTYLINDVPNRTNILIHPGNYSTDTNGCILPGLRFVPIDTQKIVVQSQIALNAIKNKLVGYNKIFLSIQNLQNILLTSHFRDGESNE